MLDFDYKLEPEYKDDRVGNCCICGVTLYSIDDVLLYHGETYCCSNCLKSDIGPYSKEITEHTSCDFCGSLICEGEDAVTDLDGLIFCDTCCMFEADNIEVVYGYDM